MFHINYACFFVSFSMCQLLVSRYILLIFRISCCVTVWSHKHVVAPTPHWESVVWCTHTCQQTHRCLGFWNWQAFRPTKLMYWNGKRVRRLEQWRRLSYADSKLICVAQRILSSRVIAHASKKGSKGTSGPRDTGTEEQTKPSKLDVVTSWNRMIITI